MHTFLPAVALLAGSLSLPALHTAAGDAPTAVDAVTQATPPARPDTVATKKKKPAGRKDNPLKRPKKQQRTTAADSTAFPPRGLHVGGYGEAVFSRNFYSDIIYRYQNPAKYKNDPAHGRFDIPHAVLYVNYEFGKGWRMGSEIEFEHGGTGGAYEQEYFEGGEWEQETERGGEVELEQFWIEKTFTPWLNVRAGHIVVPVGLTNAHHEPLCFFGVYRPEGEATILPCTWHQTGLSLWGEVGRLRYEVQALAALDAFSFSQDNWVQDGAASAFEFSTATKIGLAARLDYHLTPSLRLGLSGYYAHTMHNSYPHDLEGNDENGQKKRYSDLKGQVAIAAFDFCYDTGALRVQGSADYGYFGDAGQISAIKQNLTANTAPTDKSRVGKNAYAIGIEAGYDVLRLLRLSRAEGQRLFVFARYDNYDSFVPAHDMAPAPYTHRQVVTAGINYMPLPQIAIKAQYAQRFLKSAYNNEPSISLGVAYQGMFF